jgi:hypothetical protein
MRMVNELAGSVDRAGALLVLGTPFVRFVRLRVRPVSADAAALIVVTAVQIQHASSLPSILSSTQKIHQIHSMLLILMKTIWSFLKKRLTFKVINLLILRWSGWSGLQLLFHSDTQQYSAAGAS